MNKKAVFNPVEISFYLFCTILIAIFIALATFQYRNEKIDTTNIETFILSKKLINTDSCLAYEDSPGVMDIEKLNSQRLIGCFTKEGLGYSVKILDLDNNLIKSAENFNQIQKTNLPICKTVPRHKCITRRDIVNYYSEGEIRTGYLNIEVINFVG